MHVLFFVVTDTNCGLENGALGTVLSVKHDKVTVKFDHVSVPYGVKRVRNRFMVMRNLYVYREHFLLILAYAVTIHKCQGLSLDCAIVDLSEKVFSAGMAYVAPSRVRTLSGLHLLAFDPASIRVSTQCLKEVNRLRETFRKDLPLYTIPHVSDKTKCKKLTGSVQLDQSKTKKLVKSASKTLAKQLQSNRSVQTPDKRVPKKRKSTDVCMGEKPTKKPAITTNTEQVHVDPPPKMVPVTLSSRSSLRSLNVCGIQTKKLSMGGLKGIMMTSICFSSGSFWLEFSLLECCDTWRYQEQ